MILTMKVAGSIELMKNRFSGKARHKTIFNIIVDSKSQYLSGAPLKKQNTHEKTISPFLHFNSNK